MGSVKGGEDYGVLGGSEVIMSQSAALPKSWATKFSRLFSVSLQHGFGTSARLFSGPQHGRGAFASKLYSPVEKTVRARIQFF